MKPHWLVLTALCLLLVGTVVAQSSSSVKMTTNVPFDFVVNGTTLPAGDYVVSTYTSGHLLMIQNKDMPEYVKVVSNTNVALHDPNAIHRSSKLVFRLNNGQHVLHQIYITGDDHAHDIVHGNDVAELVATW